MAVAIAERLVSSLETSPADGLIGSIKRYDTPKLEKAMSESLSFFMKPQKWEEYTAFLNTVAGNLGLDKEYYVKNYMEKAQKAADKVFDSLYPNEQRLEENLDKTSLEGEKIVFGTLEVTKSGSEGNIEKSVPISTLELAKKATKQAAKYAVLEAFIKDELDEYRRNKNDDRWSQWNTFLENNRYGQELSGKFLSFFPPVFQDGKEEIFYENLKSKKSIKKVYYGQSTFAFGGEKTIPDFQIEKKGKDPIYIEITGLGKDGFDPRGRVIYDAKKSVDPKTKARRVMNGHGQSLRVLYAENLLRMQSSHPEQKYFNPEELQLLRNHLLEKGRELFNQGHKISSKDLRVINSDIQRIDAILGEKAA
jgi:hypothetical protein